ncbi:uncharacterized protein B0J16DRAFT_393992 [Fusarium flagelliforme]|uniref:Uncharacterized protein n=1 Tax=Fusarium flagelliforme TaxID=2675880 RepID=A0A395N5E9_9HYPO|nr:uncharacterized protein B0J16DRAFT_393992 [Fusarium flagelliforme]KAH7191905.1 hypothetical protein B0J16DRAFT_393992 [Fusarium flagelliforme]RFN55117.1 hypothetical protein FIE12Z_629 [Fusarium flagelliforme]
MDGHDIHDHSSQAPPANRVDDVSQSQQLSIEAGTKKKRGRPAGSKNKSKNIAPHPEGIQLRNRSLPVPHYTICESEDETHDDQAVQENGSEYDDFASEANSLDFHRKAFREGVQKMGRRIDDRGPVTKETFLSQHPLSPSSGSEGTAILNQTNADDLDRAWECSVDKAAILLYPSRADTFISVWRLSLRLFGVDPLTLVSLYQDVEFDNSASDSFEHLGVFKQNPLWTIAFCKRLERIMVHPLFSDENAFRFIPVIIRWTVICRAGDGHGFTDKQHRLLDDFHCGNLRPANGLQALVQRFLEHQRRRKDDGLVISRQAKLMSLVAGLAKTAGESPETDITRVKTRDLSIIVKGLDALENGTMTTSCEMYHLIYSTCQEPRGYPVGMDGLLEAYKISWIKLQRRKTSNRSREDTNITRGRPGELIVGRTHERTSAVAGHTITSEGRNSRVSETTSNSAQRVIHHHNRSTSIILEDGEVHEGSEPLASSPSGNEYIHQSRRCLIESRQGSEALAASDADDEHLHESRRSLIESNHGSANSSWIVPRGLPRNDSKSFLNQGTIQTGPSATVTRTSFGRNTIRAGGEAQELANPVTVKREPDRGLGEGEEFSFLDIDRVLGRVDGIGGPNHGTAWTSATSNRVSEPAMRSNRVRKRSSRGHREQRPAKRHNTHGAHHRQSEQSDGRDKNTGRRKNGVGHQGGFRPPPAQPPNGPRAWRLEQRFKGK